MHSEPRKTGAFHLARALKEHGVRHVFGVCGDHINALYHAATLEGIEVVGCRTESGAIQMADGWARVTRELAVAFVTGCPGHTNALTGMAVATNAGSPVLVISGLTPVNQRERGGSQVMHQADLAKPVTKWAIEVPDATHIAEMVGKAVRIATSGLPGAVSLSVPSDILDQPLPENPDDPDRYIRPIKHREPLRMPSHIDTEAQKDLLEAITQAKQPAIILGTGAREVGSNIGELVRTLGMPVFTIDQSRGLVPDDGKFCFGYADPLFNSVFRKLVEADLVLLVGAAIDFHTCFGRKQLMREDVRIIQVSNEIQQLNQCKQADIALLGSPATLLEALAQHTAQATTRNQWGRWLETMRTAFSQARGGWDVQCENAQMEDEESIHPLQVCASLARYQSEETSIIIDAGDFVHWPRAYFPALSKGRWMDAVLIGNLGGSVPLGIGSQIAHGKGQTWVFIGDGGFGYYAWDLEVAAERQLPIKIILGNDSAWGIEKRLQIRDYGAHVGCELREMRYDNFAKMMGIVGIHAERPGDVDHAVDQLMAASGPALLDVRIRPMAGRPLADFPRY